jgi:cytochrome c oxidase subunit 2
MKGIIIIETQQEYDKWIAGEKPGYYKAFPERDPNAAPPVKTDSAATAAKTVAMTTK